MPIDERSVAPPHIDRERLTRGLAGFAVLAVAGLSLLFVVTNRGSFETVVRGLSAGFFTLAILSMLADLLIGAIRYQIFLVRIRPGISLLVPLKADFATRFAGAVTPSQTGGGPAQLFVLWKEGIPVPAALSFLMINLLSTLLFFLLAGGAAAWLLKGYFPADWAQWMLMWGFASFALSFTFILACLIRPDLIVRGLTPTVRRLESNSSGWARAVAGGGRVLVGSIEKYRESCVEFTREAPWLPVASFLLTAGLYANKFVLGYFLVRGLGVDAPFMTVIGAQALIYLVTLIIPTPGGSGFAELGTGAIMSILLPAELLGPFTLAQRMVLTYLPAAVGAVVLADVLRPRSRLHGGAEEDVARRGRSAPSGLRDSER